MIENYLIAGGCKGGPKTNFRKWVLNDQELNKSPRWYFRTPVKYSGDGLKSAILDMAFPFHALIDDSKDDEAPILARLEATKKEYIDELLFFFRSNNFIVPPDSVNPTLIAFWAGDTNPKEENKTYQGLTIHILNVVLTVEYRNLPLATAIEQTELVNLENEQAALEIKLDKLNSFIASTIFNGVEFDQQALIIDQSDAMTEYNNALKARILILKT